MNDELRGWVTVEVADEQLAELDTDLTHRVMESNPGKIIASPDDPRAAANADGRWDTWGGDGVGP